MSPSKQATHLHSSCYAEFPRGKGGLITRVRQITLTAVIRRTA